MVGLPAEPLVIVPQAVVPKVHILLGSRSVPGKELEHLSGMYKPRAQRVSFLSGGFLWV
jgi:hypothetical protein